MTRIAGARRHTWERAARDADEGIDMQSEPSAIERSVTPDHVRERAAPAASRTGWIWKLGAIAVGVVIAAVVVQRLRTTEASPPARIPTGARARRARHRLHAQRAGLSERPRLGHPAQHRDGEEPRRRPARRVAFHEGSSSRGRPPRRDRSPPVPGAARAGGGQLARDQALLEERARLDAQRYARWSSRIRSPASRLDTQAALGPPDTRAR